MVTRRDVLGGMAMAAAAGPTLALAQGDAFQSALTSADFIGAALVTKRGAVLHRQAYGAANHEHGVVNTPQTRFLIASITKTMTAGGVLKLAGESRIDLDAPVSRYMETPAAWAPIRVSQLLDHSHGIPDLVRQPGFGARVAQRTSLEETVAYLRNLPLDFTPGADFVYGNSGAIVAARMIEVVSGRSYPDYLRTSIYAPLGMNNSGFADSRAVIPHLATGYRMRDGALNRAEFLDMTVPLGAGSEYSTVDDLGTWISALEANRLAPPALTRRMFTANAGGYGMAWRIDALDGHRSVAHVGDINGFGSYLLRLPEEDVTVVVLSNMERTPVRQLAEALGRAALQPR